MENKITLKTKKNEDGKAYNWKRLFSEEKK